MSEFSPRTSTQLFGHEEAEARLLAEAAAGKLPHGIILSGPRGIGKATLAFRLARALLAGQDHMGMDAEHPVFKRVAAGSHSDLLVIEPAYDEKKDDVKREILIEQVQEIGSFLSLTGAESARRVVIVDPAEAMTVKAANAILKVLEEPPQASMLILISHNPGGLLPTIRSRCRQVKLKPLSQADFARALEAIMPQTDESHLQALGELSGHAPGIAAELEEQEGAELYHELLTLLGSLPAIHAASLHAFADTAVSSQPHTRWRLLTRLLLALFARAAKVASGAGVDYVSREEEEALATLAALHPAAVWAIKWQQLSDQFLLAERLHLDYKQMIIAYMHTIASKEGFTLGNTAA